MTCSTDYGVIVSLVTDIRSRTLLRAQAQSPLPTSHATHPLSMADGNPLAAAPDSDAGRDPCAVWHATERCLTLLVPLCHSITLHLLLYQLQHHLHRQYKLIPNLPRPVDGTSPATCALVPWDSSLWPYPHAPLDDIGELNFADTGDLSDFDAFRTATAEQQNVAKKDRAKEREEIE
ncbi:hypothetical protein F5148DRAFT_1265479, partial [Russula earlei]